jgi:hypothetical protein
MPRIQGPMVQKGQEVLVFIDGMAGDMPRRNCTKDARGVTRRHPYLSHRLLSSRSVPPTAPPTVGGAADRRMPGAAHHERRPAMRSHCRDDIRRTDRILPRGLFIAVPFPSGKACAQPSSPNAPAPTRQPTPQTGRGHEGLRHARALHTVAPRDPCRIAGPTPAGETVR